MVQGIAPRHHEGREIHMSAAAKIGKKAVWVADNIVNMFVLAVILLLLVFGCYAVWDSGLVTSEASAARYEAYKPSAQDGEISFQELQEINPDVFAWLTVYGTNIDYPVVQGGDNMKYVNTNAEGRYSLSGAIFLDCGNNPDFSDFNSIIYGHHMEKQTMFGEIGRFADKEYFDARRYGTLYYGGEEHGLEFFAFFHCDAYDTKVFKPNITGRDNQQAYLNMLLDMAIHIRYDMPVTADDRIVLLSTCSASSTNGRDILVGRITGEIYGDPFKTEITDKTNYIPVIDEFTGLWTHSPILVRVIIVVLPLLLILLLVVLTYTRKQKRHSRKKRNISDSKGDR